MGIRTIKYLQLGRLAAAGPELVPPSQTAVWELSLKADHQVNEVTKVSFVCNDNRAHHIEQRKELLYYHQPPSGRLGPGAGGHRYGGPLSAPGYQASPDCSDIILYSLPIIRSASARLDVSA